MFIFMTHVELTFVWCEVRVEVQFCCTWITSSATFPGKTLIFPLNCLGTFVENQLVLFDSSIYEFSILFCSSISIYLNNSGFIVHLEIGWYKIFNFFLFIIIILGPLHICLQFRIHLINFYQKACWEFGWDCIESVGQFGEDHFNNIETFNPQTWCMS